MQSQEVISQENPHTALRDELREVIKEHLKHDFQFLKVSPLRRVPPKDLSIDVDWIDRKLRLAKWIKLCSGGLLLVFFTAMLLAVFTKEKLVFEPAYSLLSIFSFISFISAFTRWNKNEILLKILRKLVS